MNTEYEKIEKAKTILQKIGKGVDPLTGELIEKDSFLNDPKIMRCFYFMTEVLDNVLNGTYRMRGNKFVISPEQKSKVKLTQGKVGVNEFSRCINECIDINSKKLTGVELNRKLRKLGILGEETTTEGKIKTIINNNSAQYGFESEKRSFKGVEYDAIVINDKGKKYLLDNLESIMEASA